MNHGLPKIAGKNCANQNPNLSMEFSEQQIFLFRCIFSASRTVTDHGGALPSIILIESHNHQFQAIRQNSLHLVKRASRIRNLSPHRDARRRETAGDLFFISPVFETLPEATSCSKLFELKSSTTNRSASNHCWQAALLPSRRQSTTQPAYLTYRHPQCYRAQLENTRFFFMLPNRGTSTHQPTVAAPQPIDEASRST